ncbi:MAG: PIN domain-containing protein [Phycisphaerales bacterium]|nr:PIN domain-containing protein [Phycisphaerales bacterium]
MNAVDTNILVYALSADEVTKSAAAGKLLESLSSRDTVLLWQVACEFGAVLAKLVARGTADARVLDAMQGLRARFPLILPSPDILDSGLRIHREQQVSYWDAMLLAACAEAGVDRLYSEDIPGQPTVAGVAVVNPFG